MALREITMEEVAHLQLGFEITEEMWDAFDVETDKMLRRIGFRSGQPVVASRQRSQGKKTRDFAQEIAQDVASRAVQNGERGQRGPFDLQ